MLVEQVVDTIRGDVKPHDLDYVHFSASNTPERDICAQLNQYPIDPHNRRLVIIRDAEKIKKWDGILDWLMSRLIPQVIAVLIDGRIEVDTKLPHLDRIIKSGRYVKCGPLNEDDAAAYIQDLGDIDPRVAKLLLHRVGGSLQAAADVMGKASYFKGSVDERVIEFLTDPSPADSFMEDLLHMHKRGALTAIERVPESDYSRLLGTLDFRLEGVHRVHKAMQRQQGVFEIIKTTGLQPFVVKNMLEYAKHYDRPRVRNCISALAFVDSQYQHGARDGLLETLVALW